MSYGETELREAFIALTGEQPEPEGAIVELNAKADGASGGVVVEAIVATAEDHDYLATIEGRWINKRRVEDVDDGARKSSVAPAGQVYDEPDEPYPGAWV